MSDPRSIRELLRICKKFCLSTFFTIWLLMIGYLLVTFGLIIFQFIFLRPWLLITLPITVLFLPTLFSTVMLVRVYGVIIGDRNTEKHAWDIAKHKFWYILGGRLLYALATGAIYLIVLGVPYLLIFSEIISGNLPVYVFLGIFQCIGFIVITFLAVKFYLWRLILLVEDSHILEAFAKSYHITTGSWWLIFRVIIAPFLFVFVMAIISGILKTLGASLLITGLLLLCVVLYSIIVVGPWLYVTQVVLLEELDVRFEHYRIAQLSKKWKQR